MSQLTPVQSQVLAGLLAGQPIAAVARENGIDRTTIYHWRKDHPHFTLALDQARSRLQTALYDDVQDLVAQALEVLAELLHSPDEKIRLRVAQTLLRAANPMKANIIQHREWPDAPPPEHRETAPTPASSIEKALAALDAAEAEFLTIRQNSPQKSTTHSTVPPPSQSTIPIRSAPRAGRNQPCPCKSGMKFKKCCGNPARPAATAAPSCGTGVAA